MEDEAEVVVPEGHLTALVVAEGKTERDSVASALRGVRMHVTAVGDPYQALLQFLHTPARLVVLSLEGLTRRDRRLLRELRRLAPDLRVLLLATESRRSEVGDFLAAGADAWLPAPVYGRELGLVAKALVRADGADGLTGLPNKPACDSALQREIARAKRENRTLGFGLLDLDGFGDVNTDHGFLNANGLLQEVARRLRATIRVTDVVCRWGWDEFAVLLTGLARDPDAASADGCLTLNRAREAIANLPFRLRKGPQKSLRVTIKGGLALFVPEAPVAPDDLFNLANTRLLMAKRRGGNCIQCGDGPCQHPPPPPPPPSPPRPPSEPGPGAAPAGCPAG